MGRARNSSLAVVAVANDQFDGVFGHRRGGRHHEQDIPYEWEIGRIDEEFKAWRQSMTDLANLTGARTSWRTMSLVSRKYAKAVHILPDGEAYLDEAKLHYTRTPPKTLCGVTVAGNDWRSYFRGDFLTPVNDRTRPCSRCLKKADPEVHWQAFETRDDLEPVAPQTMRRVRADLIENWLPNFAPRMLAEPALVREVVALHARRAVREEIMANHERALFETLGRGTGAADYLERQLGLERRSLTWPVLARWMTPKDWDELLERFWPKHPGGGFIRDHDVWRRAVSEKLLDVAARPGNADQLPAAD